jgi:hypothetical protein
MSPIALNMNGIQLTLVSIEKDKTYDCKCEEADRHACKLKKFLSLNQSKSTLIATEVLFNVQNRSGGSWKIPANPWELIDRDGIAHQADVLCRALRPPLTTMPGSWSVSSVTQMNFTLIFPEIEKSKEIARIRFVENGTAQAFEIKTLKLDAMSARAKPLKPKQLGQGPGRAEARE